MVILCFLLLMAALTVDLKVDNSVVALFSAAGVFYGLAEMACRPFQTRIVAGPPGLGWGKVYGRPRHLNGSGVFLFCIAATFAGFGFWRLWNLLLANA